MKLHLANREGMGRAQRGFSMIEVLITLLIISLALLGTAGLQAYSMRLNQGGQFRSQAVFLVADLAERMEANKPGAVLGNDYVVALSDSPVVLSTLCSTQACSADQLASYDLSQWQNAVAAALPQSSWQVDKVAGNPATYTIRVSWVDRAVDTTNAAFNAGSDVGSNAAGTGERFFYTATRSVFN